MEVQDFVKRKGCLTVEVGIVWDKPVVPDQFKFPRLVSMVRVINPATGDPSEFITETEPHELIQDIMTEAYSEIIHPSLRQFVARVLFDQFYAITGSEAYQAAHSDWVQWNKETIRSVN